MREEYKVKTCAKCTFMCKDKGKNTKPRVQILKDKTKKVYPINPRVDYYCDKSHNLKFGVIDCDDFIVDLSKV